MGERRIGRSNLEGFLADLEARDGSDAITAYITPGRCRESLRELEARVGHGLEELSQVAQRVEGSPTGAVVFWSEGDTRTALPPFPVSEDRLLDGWDVTDLRVMLAKDYLIGVVLLRLGRFAVGVFRGETLVSSKTDTRYVKGRHSAGGTSQGRFQRIREKQVQQIFQKTCSVAKEKFLPFEAQMDYILLGGERFTVQAFLKSCDYLRRLSPKILGTLLNVREPRHDALEAIIGTIWETRVLSIQTQP